MSTEYLEGIAMRRMLLGPKVVHATITHSIATVAIYHVYAGAVLMTGLVGKVVTAAGAACNLTWTHVPTTGTAQPVAALLDVDPALVGDYLTITGLATDAMTYNASAAGLRMMSVKGVILAIGDLSLTMSAVQGSTSWSVFYVPIEDGAYIRAV